MCQNQTIGVDSASGHSFGCADSGASKGCTTTLGIKTCICEGTLCNEYSSAVSISTSLITVLFALLVSGFTFMF